MEYISCKPGYGRDYTTQKQVKEAFDKGQDFEITSVAHRPGAYINKDDLPPNAKLSVRYAKGTKQYIVG